MLEEHSKFFKKKFDINNIILFLYIGNLIFARIIPSFLYSFFSILFGIYIIFFKIIYKNKVVIRSSDVWYWGFFFNTLITLIYLERIYTPYFTSVIVTAFSMLLFTQMLDNISKIYNTLKYIVFWGVVFNIYTLTQIGNLNNNRLGNYGTLGNFTNAISYSYYIIVITVSLIWIYIYKEKSSYIMLPMITLSFFLAGLSGGRKAIFLPLLFLTILIYLKNKKNSFKLFGNIIFIITLFYILYIVVTKIPLMYDAVGYRIEDLINLLLGKSKLDSSAIERQFAFENGLKLFGRKPFIGNGFGSSRQLYSNLYNWSSHAHNNYVELLISGGVVMVSTYYWIYPYIIIKLSKIRKNKKDGLIDFFIAFMIMNLVSDFGTVSFNIYLYNIFIVMASAYIENVKVETE